MRKDQEQDLVVYGLHPVNEALDNPDTVEKVFVKEGFSGQPMKDLIKKSRALRIPCFIVPSQKLDRLTNTRNHQGVAAFVSAVAYGNIENLIPTLMEQGVEPRIIVLDGVTDVRNFGAIARTAEFLGFHALVIPARGSARFNEDAIKSSAGALLKLPVCRTHVLKQTVFFLKHSGLRIVGASEKAETNAWETDLTGPIAIVVGSEDEGISKPILKLCDEIVKVPQLGQVESLNVSVAAGMLAYEVVKQAHKTI
jgi:23S rRNA (guanosine2251-2'-O)-methyltransferase